MNMMKCTVTSFDMDRLKGIGHVQIMSMPGQILSCSQTIIFKGRDPCNSCFERLKNLKNWICSSKTIKHNASQELSQTPAEMVFGPPKYA